MKIAQTDVWFISSFNYWRTNTHALRSAKIVLSTNMKPGGTNNARNVFYLPLTLCHRLRDDQNERIWICVTNTHSNVVASISFFRKMNKMRNAYTTIQTFQQTCSHHLRWLVWWLIFLLRVVVSRRERSPRLCNHVCCAPSQRWYNWKYLPNCVLAVS